MIKAIEDEILFFKNMLTTVNQSTDKAKITLF